MNNEAAGYFYEFLLRYVIDCFTSYNEHSLEEISAKLVDDWPNVAVAISLLQHVMSYSSEQARDDIVECVAANMCIFNILFLAFQAGMRNGKVQLYFVCVVSCNFLVSLCQTV